MERNPSFFSTPIAKSLCAKQGHHFVSLVTGVEYIPKINQIVAKSEVMCQVCGLPVTRVRGRIGRGNPRLGKPAGQGA